MQEAKTGVNSNDEWNRLIPASSRWLASQHGHKRGMSRVHGKDEWDYFKQRYLDFQGDKSDEADSYTSINFSTYASEWNNWVHSLGETLPTVTYKTASHLQDAFKIMKQQTIRHSTVRPVLENLANLRRTHREPEPAHNLPEEFVDANTGERVIPVHNAVQVELDSEFFDAVSEEEVTVEPKRRRKRRREVKRRKPQRCRKCGHPWRTDRWITYHCIPTATTHNNRVNQLGRRAADHCTVPEAIRALGFPLPYGARFPIERPHEESDTFNT